MKLIQVGRIGAARSGDGIGARGHRANDDEWAVSVAAHIGFEQGQDRWVGLHTAEAPEVFAERHTQAECTEKCACIHPHSLGQSRRDGPTSSHPHSPQRANK